MDVLAQPMLRCRQLGIFPTRHFLLVSIARQKLFWFMKPPCSRRYELHRSFRCSTSRFGIGQRAGSNCTPLGLHRIAEKIGGGWPMGTVFTGRKVVGFTWKDLRLSPITTRILWLDGLEPGFNRGGDVDTHARYVYIHGTGDEPTLGRPASPGCVHLAADDLIPLYDQLSAETLVWIQRS